MPGFVSSLSNSNDAVFAKNADFSLSSDPSSQNGLITDGQLWIGHTDANINAQHVFVGNIVAGTGITVGYSSPNITVASTAATTDLHVAKLIVNSSGTSGTGANFSTLASAMTAAVSGDTIFVMPGATGVYTENVTLKAGVNICAFDCDALTPNVTIAGTLTHNTAGTVSISGIRLQTNSAALLSVTGSATSIVNLNNCYLNCTNATGITFSVSNAAAKINMTNCGGDLGTTGIGLFAHSSSGTMNFSNCNFTNTGLSLAASTCSAGVCNAFYTLFNSATTFSGTSGFTWEYVGVFTVGISITSLTAGGSNTQSTKWSRYNSGTASAVSIGGTLQMEFCDISSSNTNAITGVGTVTYSGLVFSGISTTINTTTQINSGTLQGSKNTAPSAGFLGEQIISVVTLIPVLTGVPTNITSILLTPGVWDITTSASAVSSTVTGSAFIVGISTTSSTFAGSEGDQRITINPNTLTNSSFAGCIPAYRVVISSSTTYFMIGQLNFSGGTSTFSGRLSAVRVA